MGITHDLALLDLAVLLEHLGDLGLAQAGMDASDKEVRAGVDGSVIIVSGTLAVLSAPSSEERV